MLKKVLIKRLFLIDNLHKCGNIILWYLMFCCQDWQKGIIWKKFVNVAMNNSNEKYAKAHFKTEVICFVIEGIMLMDLLN